jgi:Zn-dependent alcohol dehydrogenase
MHMKTQAAILWDRGESWSVEEIDLDPPKRGEGLVEMGGSGLCQSDEHAVTGDIPWGLPMVGGHEGAGTVVETGPGVDGLNPGDQVVLGFIPACGRCASCSPGMQNLCELGQYLHDGLQISDHTSRHHARGRDLGLNCHTGSPIPNGTTSLDITTRRPSADRIHGGMPTAESTLNLVTGAAGRIGGPVVRSARARPCGQAHRR